MTDTKNTPVKMMRPPMSPVTEDDSRIKAGFFSEAELLDMSLPDLKRALWWWDSIPDKDLTDIGRDRKYTYSNRLSIEMYCREEDREIEKLSISRVQAETAMRELEIRERELLLRERQYDLQERMQEFVEKHADHDDDVPEMDDPRFRPARTARKES